MTKNSNTGATGPTPFRVIGIPWYRREDYGRIKALMLDGAVLNDTFDDWLKRAEALEQGLQAKGQRTSRAIIDPNTFADWCRQNGQRPDADGRVLFAKCAADRSAHGGTLN
jgi:hypothetical protein